MCIYNSSQYTVRLVMVILCSTGRPSHWAHSSWFLILPCGTYSNVQVASNIIMESVPVHPYLSLSVTLVSCVKDIINAFNHLVAPIFYFTKPNIEAKLQQSMQMGQKCGWKISNFWPNIKQRLGLVWKNKPNTTKAHIYQSNEMYYNTK